MMSATYIVGTALPRATGIGPVDKVLFATNLFLMTAFACLALMMATRMGRTMWRRRHVDAARHPVSIWRLAWWCASSATFLRCGADAMYLWAWSPRDGETAASVILAKQWIDPLALVFAGGWMALVLLTANTMERHLCNRPYPVSMCANAASLSRPLAIILLSLAAAIGVVVTR